MKERRGIRRVPDCHKRPKTYHVGDWRGPSSKSGGNRALGGLMILLEGGSSTGFCITRQQMSTTACSVGGGIVHYGWGDKRVIL